MIDKKDESKAPAQKRTPKYRKGQRYKMADRKSIHCTGTGCLKGSEDGGETPGDDIKLAHLVTNTGGDAEHAFNEHLEAGTIVEA